MPPHWAVKLNPPNALPFATRGPSPRCSRLSPYFSQLSVHRLPRLAIPKRHKSRLRSPPLATQSPKTLSYPWLVRLPESAPPWFPTHPRSWAVSDIHTAAEGRCDNTRARLRRVTARLPTLRPRR